ncbi:MAG: glycosyltransferase [Bacteroidales bacterium]|nr:glycosyltransferase [Bacteroidales bacterium]
MKISLITATYNSAETVRDTLQSVLNQTFKDIDHIIIDGNSKDNTMDIVKEFEPKFEGRLRWVSEKDKGIYDAMNKGVRMAQGDIVGILNSDDFFASNDVLEKVNAAFTENPAIDGVYADVRYVDWNDTGKTVRMFSGKDFTREKLCWGKMPPHPSFYVKRECYDKFGLYSLDYPICADYDMFVKMIWIGNINTLYINDVFVNMRSGGTSSNGIKVHRKIMRERMRCVREHNMPSNFFKQTTRYFEKIFSLLRK